MIPRHKDCTREHTERECTKQIELLWCIYYEIKFKHAEKEKESTGTAIRRAVVSSRGIACTTSVFLSNVGMV
jgi:hypothetical protein